MRRNLLLMWVALLGWVTQLGARQVYQLGGTGGVSWEGSGTLTFIDMEKAPGGIQPFETELSRNLAPLLLERGGTVSTNTATEAIPTDWNTDRFSMVDGDSTTAFVHEPQINIYGGAGNYYTVDMRFDLGAPFPVEHIRLRTRPDHPENLMRIYRLWINDGSERTQTEFGDPIWTLLGDEPDNLAPVIDLDIEPQVIRFIRLRPWEADVTWELAELEVYGQGFVPHASFVSNPIDLGAVSSLGHMGWSGRRDLQAKILIQTRSGSDDQPEIYWRKTGIGDQQVPFDEQGRSLTRKTYDALEPVKKGRITQDLENWSVWQTYGFDEGLAGARILSPSPRRYVQLRIDFFSAGQEGGHIDSLRFEYSQPPLAREVVGEIHPLTVKPSAPVRFTYLLRTHLDAGQTGFDVLEVRAPAAIDTVFEVRIEGEKVDYQVALLAGEPPGFAVHFPRVVQDQTRLEVDFQARVFRYGTLFSGVVLDSETGDVPMRVSPGNAVDEVFSDGLNVRTTLSGEGLLSAVRVQPNPFSPNGDGINDQLQISYDLLRVTRPVPMEASIYDLAGRRVRLLVRQEGDSDSYQVTWDGRDDRGERVRPGIYLYRVEVEAESDKGETTGHIVVVY